MRPSPPVWRNSKGCGPTSASGAIGLRLEPRLDIFAKEQHLKLDDLEAAKRVLAAQAFGFGYGSELLVVRREDIDALLAGKAWAFPVNGGEYSQFIVLAPNCPSEGPGDASPR